jgi:uncharacterized protein YegP (UPF0339 family)
MHIELFTDVDAQWRFRFKAANGNVLATSEAYSSKTAMEDTLSGIARVLLRERGNVSVVELHDGGKAEFKQLSDYEAKDG